MGIGKVIGVILLVMLAISVIASFLLYLTLLSSGSFGEIIAYMVFCAYSFLATIIIAVINVVYFAAWFIYRKIKKE